MNKMTLDILAEAIAKDFSLLREQIGGVSEELAGVKADVATLKTDVATLKSDVAVLKTDVATLKSDVAVLKSDVADIKVELKSLAGYTKEGFLNIRSTMEDYRLEQTHLRNRLEILEAR